MTFPSRHCGWDRSSGVVWRELPEAQGLGSMRLQSIERRRVCQFHKKLERNFYNLGLPFHWAKKHSFRRSLMNDDSPWIKSLGLLYSIDFTESPVFMISIIGTTKKKQPYGCLPLTEWTSTEFHWKRDWTQQIPGELRAMTNEDYSPYYSLRCRLWHIH